MSLAEVRMHDYAESARVRPSPAASPDPRMPAVSVARDDSVSHRDPIPVRALLVRRATIEVVLQQLGHKRTRPQEDGGTP